MTEKNADLLGIKSFGEAANTLAKGVVDAAGAFLGRICLPAAEEFGLYLEDKVSAWRTKNTANIVLGAKQILESQGGIKNKHAHPRLVHTILENGSWVEDTDIQKMWAGLLASSCTESGDCEENLMFSNLLKQLTSLQVKILKYACEHSEKYIITPTGLPFSNALYISTEKLKAITGVVDIHRLDRELDHLRSLELIIGGYNSLGSNPEITPTALSMHLYVRGHGSEESPVSFFGITKTR
ncbi:MAG: DUF4393 domain-containing protein [Deltaproteobacteria bacterium]|nr:DUF4393 domain-containing protein [Deltaproteobacteria bacterium]